MIQDFLRSLTEHHDVGLIEVAMLLNFSKYDTFPGIILYHQTSCCLPGMLPSYICVIQDFLRSLTEHQDAGLIEVAMLLYISRYDTFPRMILYHQSSHCLPGMLPSYSCMFTIVV